MTDTRAFRSRVFLHFAYAMNPFISLLRVVTLLSLLLATSSQAADNASSVQMLTSQCAACHGVKGLSTLPHAPNLAGQPVQYLDEQLKLYRSGKRQNETMNLMAKPLNDQQIAAIAAWYNAIQIQLAP